MAAITFRAGWNMLRVLPHRNNAVVAARACTENLQMVHAIDWRPRNRVVAVLAQIRRRNVIRWLAHRDHAVVAREATTNEPGMVEHRGYPRCCSMAIVTLVTGR